MASHSSVLAWRIPGMGEPDGLPSMGLHSRTWLKRLSSSSMSIESVMPSNHLILCHPLLLLPSILPSIRVFSSELALYVRWPKYWSFSFSISPSNKYLGLISFRIDSLDLLAVQGMFQSLLQHYNSKTSILQGSAFFMVQLSQLYMTTGKTITLTIWTVVSKVMSLLFHMLSRLVIALLPRSKHLLISCLQSISIVILESRTINSITVSIVSHLFAMKWWDQMPWSLFFECWVLSQLSHSPLSPSSWGSLVPLCFLPYRGCHLHIWGHWYFSQRSWF